MTDKPSNTGAANPRRRPHANGLRDGFANGRSREDRHLADYYNALLRNLRLDPQGESALKTLGLTRSPGCGAASVVATNLALAFASQGSSPVILINTDFGNRVPETTFSLSRVTGFYDVLADRVPLQDVIQDTSFPNLKGIGCGRTDRDVQSFHLVTRFREVLETLKQEYRLIVVDLPQATPLTWCFDFAALLDGVVVEVDAGRVERRAARELLDQLQFVQANVIGSVLKQI